MKSFLSRRAVLVYYLLALLFSWAVYLTLAAVKRGWVDWQVPFSIHYLASLGPALAAVIVTGLTGGGEGLKELWGRITLWKVGWGWAALSVLTPLGAFLLAMPIVRLVSGSWPDWRLLGQANYMPYLGVWVVFLWLASYGFGEETGWRGFALPRLQKTMSASKATLVLALMWAFWHVPAFFYLDTLEEMGLMVLPGFIIGVLFGAVLFTWLYNGTGGSILWVAVWHALFDMVTASKAGQEVIPIITTALVIIWALVITRVKQPWGFHQLNKHTL